ncbi:MAG: PAS domain S-box protein [Candidatus Competibacteraceae bacterium]
MAAAGESAALNRPFRADHQLHDVSDGIFDTFAPVTEAGVTFGRVEVGLATATLQATFVTARRNALAIVLIEMVLVALLSYLLGLYLTRQLSHLTNASQRMANGEFGYQMPLQGRDELARTALAFNQMSSRVQQLYNQARREELRKSAMLEAALDCVIAMDHQGLITEFNPAAETTFGYRRAEVMGRPLAEVLIPPALRQAHADGLAHYLRTGEGPVIGQRIEINALHANQSEFPVELAISAVKLAEEPLFIAYLRDLSARKQTERDRQRLLMAVESSADGILITDPDGVIRYVNPALTVITGWPSEKIIGKTPAVLKAGGCRRHFMRPCGPPYRTVKPGPGVF